MEGDLKETELYILGLTRSFLIKDFAMLLGV